jgi:two-component system, OmpR family, KDP operon response regulator KdpE
VSRDETIQHVLVVDDHPGIRRSVRLLLAAAGHSVDTAASGREALRSAMARPPDVVFLDLGLPDMGGVDVLKALRKRSDAVVIVVSSFRDEAMKVKALDEGADDYVVKPYGAAELLARSRAATRRRTPPTSTPDVSFGDVVVDLQTGDVHRRGERVALTPKEYGVLAVLARNAGSKVAQEDLLEAVWGPGGARQSQYLHVTISTLRRKLEPDPQSPRYLLTVHRVGYRLAVSSDESAPPSPPQDVAP